MIHTGGNRRLIRSWSSAFPLHINQTTPTSALPPVSLHHHPIRTETIPSFSSVTESRNYEAGLRENPTGLQHVVRIFGVLIWNSHDQQRLAPESSLAPIYHAQRMHVHRIFG